MTAWHRQILVHVSAEEKQRRRMIDQPEQAPQALQGRAEDFANIAKRKTASRGYDDRIERTDTDHAPWHVMPPENKEHAGSPAKDRRRGKSATASSSPSRR